MDDDHRPVPRHELVFDVEQALRKARKLWPRKLVPGDYNPLKPVADAVVEHLELCGIACFRRPPREPHSIPGGPLNMDRNRRDAGCDGSRDRPCGGGPSARVRGGPVGASGRVDPPVRAGGGWMLLGHEAYSWFNVSRRVLPDLKDAPFEAAMAMLSPVRGFLP